MHRCCLNRTHLVYANRPSTTKLVFKLKKNENCEKHFSKARLSRTTVSYIFRTLSLRYLSSN